MLSSWDSLAVLAAKYKDEALDAGQDPVQNQIVKLMEELGEVAQAFIGWSGQNHRKGYSHSIDDVISELADVVITAQVALITASANTGYSPISHYADKLHRVTSRALDLDE